MKRRELLVGMGATATLPWVGARAAVALDLAAAPMLTRAAYDAYIYTLPLIESATARAGLLRQGVAVGAFAHLRAPTTPATQRITTPNNDTLNSRAWIDLARGPLRLSWPATGARYISIAMMDMWSNNFAVLGSRTTGPEGGAFTIVGPDVEAPPGAIRAPTRWMWLLVRLLVDGPDDLARANAIQDRYRLTGPSTRDALPIFAHRDAPWQAYFTSAGRLMVENPGPATDTAMLQRIAPLRLDRFDPSRFSTAEANDIAAGVARARSFLAAQSVTGPTVAGWTYPRPNLGDFGQDYAYRAQTALNGFAALPNEEAMYAFAAAGRGDMTLDSAASWRLRLKGDHLPPTDAFWSLTMYRATSDGQFFLFDTPLKRYSIGDRTAGLLRSGDGGIDVIMQRTPPATPTNWLPTPPDAPFGLSFRIYCPRQSVLDGSWRLPPIERLRT